MRGGSVLLISCHWMSIQKKAGSRGGGGGSDVANSNTHHCHKPEQEIKECMAITSKSNVAVPPQTSQPLTVPLCQYRPLKMIMTCFGICMTETQHAQWAALCKIWSFLLWSFPLCAVRAHVTFCTGNFGKVYHWVLYGSFIHIPGPVHALCIFFKYWSAAACSEVMCHAFDVPK